jgi:hypothetical protein
MSPIVNSSPNRIGDSSRLLQQPIDKKRNDVYRRGVLRGAFALSRCHGLGVNDSLGFLGGGPDGAGSRCLGVFVARQLW